MLRAGFDLTGLELDHGGGARAARDLRAALEDTGEVDLVPVAQPERGPSGRIARGLVRELAWYPAALPRRAAQLGLDVLHCPLPLAPPRPGAVPVVLTMHDVLALEHPEWFTRANALHARLVLGRAARAAAVVLTSSAYSRGRIAERVGVDPARIAVVPPGVGERFSPGPRPDELLARIGVDDDPYLLSVATLQPRKNLGRVLAAFRRLQPPYRLVLAGARGWHDDALLGGARGERIHLTGRVTDDELVGLYRGAACFVFLSLAEGFGLPPLEAMACGTPVVCSDRTSLPEVVGDAALLVDPDDEQVIDRALRAVLSGDTDLAARGRARAAAFTWTRAARATLDAYARAARDRPAR